MTDKPQHAQSSKVNRFLLYYYWSALVGTVFYLCFLPEIVAGLQTGFKPSGTLTVISDSSPSFSDILAELWAERWMWLNPLNNFITKFFIVAAFFGLIYDRVLSTRAALNS